VEASEPPPIDTLPSSSSCSSSSSSSSSGGPQQQRAHDGRQHAAITADSSKPELWVKPIQYSHSVHCKTIGDTGMSRNCNGREVAMNCGMSYPNASTTNTPGKPKRRIVRNAPFGSPREMPVPGKIAASNEVHCAVR